MCGGLIHQLSLSIRGLQELFFPRKCVVCKKFLSENEWDVCAVCLEGLPMTYQWDIVQNAAFERLARRFEVQDAASLFFFRTESDYRNILYGIKYGNRRRLAIRMGELLGRQLAASRMFRGCQVVVPVPLHPLRRWKRGYNQAELIARGVAEAMGLPVEAKLLRRIRNTKTQTKLHGDAKIQNVQAAFAADLRRTAGLQQQGIHHLLLIDDTLTTGSTLAACVAPLLAAGFRISCATLAFAGG